MHQSTVKIHKGVQQWDMVRRHKDMSVLAVSAASGDVLRIRG